MDYLHWLPIFVGAFIILAVGVRTSFYLRKAAAERKQVEDSLRGWKEDLKTHGDVPSGQPWAPLVRRSNANDIVTRAIRTVYANRNQEPDLEALSTVLSQAEASQLAFPRSAPNLMLLGGLLGTVVGAFSSVSGLGGISSEGVTTTEFANKVSAVLSTIAPAFAATLLGIGSALVCAFIVNGALKDQSDLLARVQEFILTEVAPKVIPARRDIGVEDLRAAVELLAGHLTVLPRVLSDNARQLTESVAQASEGITKALDVAREVTERTEKSAQNIGRASKALEDSAAALEKTHDELGQVHEQMIKEFAATRERIDSGIETAVTRLGDATRAHLEGMVANSQTFRDSTAEVANRLKASVDQISSVAQGIHDIRDTFHNQAEEVWQRVGTRLDNTFTRAEKVFKQYQEKVADVSDSLEQGLNGIREKFQELLKQLDPRLWPEDEWRSMRNALETTVSEWRSIRDALQTTVSALEQLLQRLKELPEARQQVPQADEATSGAINTLAQQLTSLSNTMQELRESVNQLRTSMVSPSPYPTLGSTDGPRRAPQQTAESKRPRWRLWLFRTRR